MNAPHQNLRIVSKRQKIESKTKNKINHTYVSNKANKKTPPDNLVEFYFLVDYTNITSIKTTCSMLAFKTNSFAFI